MPNDHFAALLQTLGQDLSRMLFEDDLTGIHNRRFLLNYFQSRIPWDALLNRPVSLVMLDLDDFKDINDRFGHVMGDQILIWVADLIRDGCSGQHLPIRYAGDEFMILMDGHSKPAALQWVENFMESVRSRPLRPINKEGAESIRISLSWGIATAPDDARTGRELIQKADAALYRAKCQKKENGIRETSARNEAKSAACVKPKKRSPLQRSEYAGRGMGIGRNLECRTEEPE